MGKAVGIIDLLADDFSGYGQIERLGVGVCSDGHLFFKIAEHFRVIRDSDESLGAGTDAVCGPTHSRAAAVGVDFGDDEGCRAAVFEFKGCFGGLLPENAAQPISGWATASSVPSRARRANSLILVFMMACFSVVVAKVRKKRRTGRRFRKSNKPF